ncbi:DUF1971 domain-containing protein [Oscillatoria salina]|uniref:DUF1971 domain-containing protein n=1 Tax=Oscillatoria salina TaxID=331517 RepID=UPI0013B69E82|nr:DUF1971 domain-containing protein [Oscillatoria salina]MBZ8178571.1 DUF1971 domain-containing protein [Oscillatoria salina IIICB1]NET91388.1 DUF1971 domain-containing protein [Kamptonema sp. SIO1D9]
MKTLPKDAICYRKTPVFTQDQIPEGFLTRHSTKKGIWGKINVVSGSLRYRINADILEEHTLTPTKFGIVEPEVPHQVQPLGEVEFYVEFYRLPK